MFMNLSYLGDSSSLLSSVGDFKSWLPILIEDDPIMKLFFFLIAECKNCPLLLILN